MGSRLRTSSWKSNQRKGFAGVFPSPGAYFVLLLLFFSPTEPFVLFPGIYLTVVNPTHSHESVRIPVPFRPRHKQSALVATYDDIVESLTELSNVRKDLESSTELDAALKDILDVESVDAGIASLIGMRLAVKDKIKLEEVFLAPSCSPLPMLVFKIG